MSNNWSSYENDRLIMESWRKHINEEDEFAHLGEQIDNCVNAAEGKEGTDSQLLQEFQLPGLSWVVNLYRVTNEALAIASRAKFIPEDTRVYIAKLAEANQIMVDTMDEFKKSHPAVYKSVMGSVMAADIGGTVASKGKEYFLKALNRVLTKAGALEKEAGCPANTPYEKVWHEMGLVRDPEGKCYSTEDNEPAREALDAALQAYGAPKAQALLKKFKAEQAAE